MIQEQVFSFRENNEHCYGAAMCEKAPFLALSFGNGVLKIINMLTNNVLCRIEPGSEQDSLPATSVAWGSSWISEDSRECFGLISTSTAGFVMGWIWDSVFMERIFKLEEKENETTLCAFSPDGSHFLTGGSDHLLRLYDFKKHALLRILQENIFSTSGSIHAHTSRILSIQYCSSTVAASLGWEGTLQLWDMRTMTSDRSISGIRSVGWNALQIVKNLNLLLVSTVNLERPVRVFDYIQCDEKIEIEERLSKVCFKYNWTISALQVSEGGDFLWICPANTHMVCLLDFQSGHILSQFQLESAVLGFSLQRTNPRSVIVICQHGLITVLTYIPVE